MPPQRHPLLRRAAVAARLALRWLLRLRGSPEAVAGGVAIGVFVAFTPTIGLQTLIAFALATLLGASRPAAMLMVQVTNPFSIPPLFAVTYMVGSFLWPGPPLDEVRDEIAALAQGLGAFDLFAVRDQLLTMAQSSLDLFAALWIGGLIVGGAAALASWFGVLWLVRAQRRRRALRRTARPARIAARGAEPR